MAGTPCCFEPLLDYFVKHQLELYNGKASHVTFLAQCTFGTVFC